MQIFMAVSSETSASAPEVASSNNFDLILAFWQGPDGPGLLASGYAPLRVEAAVPGAATRFVADDRKPLWLGARGFPLTEDEQ